MLKFIKNLFKDEPMTSLPLPEPKVEVLPAKKCLVCRTGMSCIASAILDDFENYDCWVAGESELTGGYKLLFHYPKTIKVKGDYNYAIEFAYLKPVCIGLHKIKHEFTHSERDAIHAAALKYLQYRDKRIQEKDASAELEKLKQAFPQCFYENP